MEVGLPAGAVIGLLWHFAFVNTALFRLTSEEMQAG